MEPATRRCFVSRAALVSAAVVTLVSAAVAAAPSFTSPAQVSTGIDVIRAFVGDFDGDGVPDLASADRTTHVIKVRRGTGDGTTFLSPTTGFSAASGPDDIAMGDMDGDAFRDFVTVENGALVPALCHGFDPLNLSALKFERQTPLTFTGVTFDHVAAGDFNGDGKADIVGAGSHPSLETYVVVFLNDGSGGFDAGTSHSVTVPSGILALGDLTRDGRADVVMCSETAAAVSVFRNLGSGGTLADATVRFMGYKPTAVSITDITTDGVPDLVFAGYGRDFGTDNTVGMYFLRNLAQPNSQFIALNPGSSFQINAAAGDPAPFRAGVAVADFDGDGEVDFALSDPIGSRVSILQMHPVIVDGEFGGFDFPEPLTNIAVAGAVQGITSGEMESTGGKVDLVSWHGGSNGAYALLNRSTGGGGGGDALDPAEDLKFSSEKVGKKYVPYKPFYFFAKIRDASAPGFAARMQSTVTPDSESSWTDLPGAYLEHRNNGSWGEGWYTQAFVPAGMRYFRVVISATGRIDGINRQTSGPARYLGPVNIPLSKANVRATLTLQNEATGSQFAVKRGENLKCTVNVRNSGDTSAPNLYVGGTVPDGTTFVSSSPPSKMLGNLVYWDDVEVLGKSSLDFTFVVSVDAAAEPGTKFKSEGGWAKSIKKFSADVSNEVALLSSIELRATADKTDLVPGDLVTFTMGLHNFGATGLDSATVEVLPPTGTSLIDAQYLDGSGNVLQGFSPTVSADRGRVTWPYGAFQADNGYAQIRMTVRVQYDHDATTPVVLDGYTFRGNPAGGGAAITAAVVPLSIPMSGEGPASSPRPTLDGLLISGRDNVQHAVHGDVATCLAGDELQVYIAVRNAGDAALVRPSLYGALPTGTEYVPGSFTLDTAPGADPAFDDGTYRIDLADLPAGEGVVIGYLARVKGTGDAGAVAPGQLVETAQCVLASPEFFYWAIGAAVRALVLRPVDLKIDVIGGAPAGMTLGESATVRFRVTNHGDAPGAAAVAAITVSTGVVVEEMSVGGTPAAFVSKGKTASVSLGTVAPGQSLEVGISFRWASFGRPNEQISFLLNATSGLANSKVRKVEGSYAAASIAKDDPGIPRLMVLAASPLFGYRGDSYTYTFVVGNLGDAAAEGVTLWSTFAPGTTVDSQGLSDGGKEKKGKYGPLGVWSLGTIAPHSVRAVTMSVGVPLDFQGCSTSLGAQVFAKNAASKATHRVSTNIRSGGFLQFLEGIGCLFQGLSIALSGQGRESLDAALDGMSGSAISASLAGVDFTEFRNGSYVMELGGDRVLVCGRTGSFSGGTGVGAAGQTYAMATGPYDSISLHDIPCFPATVNTTYAIQNVKTAVDCGEANIVLLGGLNSASGDQVTPSKNSRLPKGVGALTPRADPDTTLKSGGGALVAAGAGNVLSHNGGAMVAAGGLNMVAAGGLNMVAAGGLNMVAAGAGNMVAAGAGNMVPADAGNLVGNNGNSVLPSGGGR